MAAFGVGAVVFMNFNLKLNSVGFYQLSKLACIPFIVAYNYIFECKKTPFLTLCSLACLLVGLTLFTVNDVQLNLLGSIIAVIAVSCVSVFQTKTGSKQKQFSVNGSALQHATALAQFVLAGICALSIETHGEISIFDHAFSSVEIVLIIITGFIAVSVNVCSFGLIGKTSPITYQVVGHMKSILIFVFGLIMFPPNGTETRAQFIKKIAGLVIAMVGVIWYTWLEMKQKETMPLPTPIPMPPEPDGGVLHEVKFQVSQ
jgi:solute carrier family 35 protein E3